MEPPKICLNCPKEVHIKVMPYPSQQKIQEAKRFCSPTCARQYGLKKSWKENHNVRTEAIRKVFSDPVRGADIKKRIAEAQKAERSIHWIDNDASYNSKHRWIQKNWKRTGICEFCKREPVKRKNGASGTEWANRTGTYDRNDRNDWLELCNPCHGFYDKAQRDVLRGLLKKG